MSMKPRTTASALARLEVGFRTDASQLQEREKDLETSLRHARQLGGQSALPEDWRSRWTERWDVVEDTLRSIRKELRQIEVAIESDKIDHLTKALESWDAIQVEEARLSVSLDALRDQATSLDAPALQEWAPLLRAVEAHRAATRACGQARRIKLELLKDHSKENVEQLVRDILTKLANDSRPHAPGTEHHDQAYESAAAELDLDRHRYLGFLDVVKSLFMWVETTEERARKNMALKEAAA